MWEERTSIKDCIVIFNFGLFIEKVDRLSIAADDKQGRLPQVENSILIRWN